MANCIANRFGVNNKPTGATVQRTDRPPDDCLPLTKILLKYYQ
jgi:hypothetical protein